MPIARKEIVNNEDIGIYNCVSRCVRRSFLCGRDMQTGKDYSYRKRWMESRIKLLSSSFCIDIVGYVIMSNHIHIILRNRPDAASRLEDREIAQKWLKIYSGRYIQDEYYEPSEERIENLLNNPERIELLRTRLSDISWFMRALKEPLARMANEEDDCKGSFWESRFKCTRLVDETALLACLAYIDLNPVRAGIANTPEESEYTSVKCRCNAREAKQRLADKSLMGKQRAVTEAIAKSDKWLASVFREEDAKSGIELIPATFDQYLQLLDWTGRQIRTDKRGAIPAELRPILERLDIDSANWQNTVTCFGKRFCRIAGKIDNIRLAAKQAGRKFFRGLGAAKQAFSAPETVT